MYVIITDKNGVPIDSTNALPVAMEGSGEGSINVNITQGIPQWTVTQDSTANASQTATKAAVSGQKHYITAFEVVISAAAAGADINVELRDGAAVKWKEYIGNAAPRGTRVGISFPQPIALSTNTAANLFVAAGGAGVVTTANMAGYTL